MPYAFKYEAFDRDPNDDGGYNRKLREVEVTVIADTEVDAKDSVNSLVSREVYQLEEITEMSDSLWTVGSGRW